MTYATRQEARREQMLSELSNNLAEMVAAGELTTEQANEWLARKADAWAAEG